MQEFGQTHSVLRVVEGRRLEANQQRFLTNAAHELRTALSNITLAAELLSTGAGEDPEARDRFLDHTLSATHRMQRLSATLLRLARLGWEKREPEIEPTNPAEVTHAAAGSMRPLAESAGVFINLEGEGVPVLADITMLEQALITLLSNAIKNSEEGEEVTLRLDGPTVFVEDQGRGISPDELPYVLERFYRNKECFGGFGLGLSICKDIVATMGGELSIRSEENVGTSVRIQLREVSECLEYFSWRTKPQCETWLVTRSAGKAWTLRPPRAARRGSRSSAKPGRSTW